jgi:hypothetical protein
MIVPQACGVYQSFYERREKMLKMSWRAGDCGRERSDIQSLGPPPIVRQQ